MAAASSPVLLSILYALLSCLAVSLLAKLLRRPAAAWSTTPAVAAPLRRTALEFIREEQREEECCAVCLCPVREGTKAACQRLECSHLFHRACLRRWVDRHRSTCPLCRAYLLLPPQVAVGETIVVAPFTFSDVEDTGRWWLR
ncbi:hypothetical protein Taro_037045 [Colocasia esculenta]|uniref:RING-type domain-containing protein n=1 Tax=Colocasia esculenta TaxID=4460 RepID=A0A843WF31_COLES|nr:hypothetical protein [Colocasia esculenta]